jgi:hypothetical protein
MPALLISTSRWPKRSSTCFAASWTVTSRVTACASPPAARSAAAASSPRVPGADQDRHAQCSELLGSPTANPLVRPGNQRDLLMCGLLAHDRFLAMGGCVLLRIINSFF